MSGALPPDPVVSQLALAAEAVQRAADVATRLSLFRSTPPKKGTRVNDPMPSLHESARLVTELVVAVCNDGRVDHGEFFRRLISSPGGTKCTGVHPDHFYSHAPLTQPVEMQPFVIQRAILQLVVAAQEALKRRSKLPVPPPISDDAATGLIREVFGSARSALMIGARRAVPRFPAPKGPCPTDELVPAYERALDEFDSWLRRAAPSIAQSLRGEPGA